jgi:hypothetical protein
LALQFELFEYYVLSEKVKQKFKREISDLVEKKVSTI